MSEMKQFVDANGEVVWAYKKPLTTPAEKLKEAFEKIPEPQRTKFLKAEAGLLLEEQPKRLEGEGRSTYVLRCQEEEANRKTVLMQRTVRDYQESLKPTKEQKVMALMEKTAKVENEKRAAKEKVKAEAEKAKAEAQAKGRALDRRREFGI